MDAWKNPTSAISLKCFPPLYSEQAPENQEMQFRVWSDLVIAWAKLHKVWSISLQECAIFECKEINREASLSLRVAIITYMVSKGWAFWIGSSQHSQAYILHKQLTELGNLIYDTLDSMGTTTPVQAHELVSDIEYSSTEFYGMPEDLMEMILQDIVKNGKMVTFKVDQDNNYKIVRTN